MTALDAAAQAALAEAGLTHPGLAPGRRTA
jgi:hypothetical protein